MSFCFSLLNRVNFYGHLFPLLISIHLSVSRAHALEEHKTRGHQTGAGQGKQELPVLSMRVKHAHTSVAFPEPLPGRFALGMAQTGFVTFRASPGAAPGPSLLLRGARNQTLLAGMWLSTLQGHFQGQPGRLRGAR